MRNISLFPKPLPERVIFVPQEMEPTGKRVVPKNHTRLRQGFGGSSADQRNPPKHDTIIAQGYSIRTYAFLRG